MNRGNTSSQASVPMNLFATWEIDRSSPSCIPRLCSLSICRLIILRELDKDLQSIFIALKMQGSKRIFRSNEIFLSSAGLADTPLELTFSLQYPHFVKRDENRLQLMLQRKKRYKNRAMLGYKTLAVGRIDMAQIIQCPITDDSLIDLYTAAKENNSVVLTAQIVVSRMSSLPIDADVESERTGNHAGADRSPDGDNYSDDDDDTSSSEQELGSDNAPEFGEEERPRRKRKSLRKARMSSSSRQQNFIKTKVAALLKKFKQVADEGLEPDLEPDPDQNPADQVDYDFLYDDLDDFNLSDSCPEIDDNISIVSTPKPKLRPFFDRLSHSSSQTEISSLKENNLDRVTTPTDTIVSTVSHAEVDEENEAANNASTPPVFPPLENLDWDKATAALTEVSSKHEAQHQLHPKLSHSNDAFHSAPSSPKVAHSTQEGRACSRSTSLREPASARDLRMQGSNPVLDMTSFDGSLPETMYMVDGADRHSNALLRIFEQTSTARTVSVAAQSLSDVQTVFSYLVLQLQKYTNSNSQAPTPLKVAVVGNEVFLNLVLRQYVEQLSSRPSEWQSFFTFYILPLGTNRIARHMSSVDSRYSSFFSESSWRESVEKLPDNSSFSSSGVSDLGQEISQLSTTFMEYLKEGASTLPLAIAEAMLTFRQTSSDEDTAQTFLPFMMDVKVGENDVLALSEVDKDDSLLPPATTSSSQTNQQSTSMSVTSPPVSPSVVVPVSSATSSPATISVIYPPPSDVKLGLQVDYWKEREAGKYTLKSNFKSFHVRRLPPMGEQTQLPGLSLDVVTKGKKIIMRLPGKKGKEKESDSKPHVIGNVNRLLCASKHQHSLLKVRIDGVEWRDIKFFQLNSHWSSHVKLFPVALFGSSLLP